MPVNAEFAAKANEVYAKGGFVPRPKGARYRHLYDLFPEFPNQQGQVGQYELCHKARIVKVELLGTFPGYWSTGGECLYRAFKVTLHTGMVVAGYSHDEDRYVMCLHAGYSPQQI
jgi:hypothetical protein